VALGPAFLPSTGHFMKRLLAWALEEGFGDPAAVDDAWGSFVLRVLRKEIPADSYAATEATLDAFFATRTRAELVEAACKRKLLLAPVLGLGDFLDSPQLAAREFLVPVDVEEAGGAVRFPGPFARFSRTPIHYERPPPRLDQHAAALRAEGVRKRSQRACRLLGDQWRLPADDDWRELGG
jgi:hypothetical protein